MMELHKGQKLLFIGDSITDCNRAMPGRPGNNKELGEGFVSFVDGLLQTAYPELGIPVLNKGISGDTVRRLSARWQEDVIDQNPDWLTVMIGINDVWRQYDKPFNKDLHISKNEFEQRLRKLVKETKPLVSGMVLMTPYYLENNESDPMRRSMDQYGEVVRKIAEEMDCVFVDTQAAFRPVLKELYPATLAWDRVHPSTAGHMVLARAFLNGIGFDWEK